MQNPEDNIISYEEAKMNGELFGLTAEEWAESEGWTISKGKQNDSTEQTPPSSPNQPPAGDSSSGDISLESQEQGIADFARRVAENVRSGNDNLIPVFIPQENRVVGVSDPYMGQVAVTSDNGEVAYYDAEAAPKISTKDDVYGTSSLGAPAITTNDDIVLELEKNPIELNAKLSNIADHNPELKTDFVSTHYDIDGLSSVGIEPADFEAWLNKNGFSEDFEKDVADGVYTSQWYDGGVVGEEFTKEEALAVAKEATLYRLLVDYIDDTQALVDKRNAVNDYMNNGDYYAEAVGYKGVLDMYYDKAIQEQALEPLYDYNQLSAYNQIYFPQLNKRNQKIAENQAAEIKKQKERNSIESFDHTLGQTVESYLKGFGDAGMDFILWAEDGILGALGNDSYVDRQRLYNQEVDAWDVKNLNYMSAEGKKVSIGDTDYLVSDDGTIYDVEAGMIANSALSEETTKVIFESAKNTEEYGSDVNVRGGAIQMGAVMGNITFQVMATGRGLGGLRAAASTRYMARANGFKNVAQYNKYMGMVNRGGTNMRGIKNASTFGLKLPFNPAVAESTIFQSFYGAASGYEQTIMAAKNAGLTNKEAEDLASQAMLEMGVLYGVTGPINPRIAAMKNLDDFMARSGVVNRAVRDYMKAGKNPIAFKESLKNGMLTVANVSKNFISEGSKEVVQENIQQLGETTIVNKRLNEAAGVDFMKETYSRKDFIETSVLSFASAGLLGSVNLSNVGFKPTNEKRVMNLYAFAKDMKGSTARLNSMVEAGRITREQADEIIESAGAVDQMIDKMPSWLIKQDEYDAVEIFKLQSSIVNMEAQKKRMDKSMHGIIDQSIAEAEKKVAELVYAARREMILKDAEKAGKLARKAGSDVIAFKTNEDMLAAGYKPSDLNADGFMEQDGKIIINAEVASKTGAISVSSHELLHNILRNELKNVLSEDQQKVIINELRAILKSRGILESLDKRAQIVNEKTGKKVYDIEFDADGNVSGSDIDEYMTFLSDAIAKEEVSFEQLGDNFWTKLGRWISNALKTQFGTKDIQFENGQQVFDFIKDYQASYKKGRLSFAAKAKAKASRGVTTGQTKMSASDLSAIAERAKQVMEKVSANMDYFDPNSPLIARVLPGMIQAQLSKLSNKGLQFDMEEATSDIILRLYSNQDIAKFDGRGTLYGYINGRIAFRIKDMLKASGEGKNDIVEDFNQSDVEDLKGAAADVTTAEQIEERAEAEAPQYKTLLEKNVVSPETLATIKEKIPRIVGTLKSKIDEPVSKNRTVTPLVNELRLALGKQIDIDLKKEMGGKKDGQLRKWLTARKKVLLENMTTTYLMGAIPIAIQKRVNGVYTSDWEGKKIDRETTSTDMAGRTSGAEMTRRLPQASMKIDDRTFLSYILEESGNPIRGKKESWAKAIAEELAIEIINEEMQNPDSKIRQAFEANQERLGVELVENYVAKLRLDFERGNVKRSVSVEEDINLIKQAALAKLQGKEAEYNIILELISPDQREKFEEFVATEIVGSATSGFTGYISSIEPASPEFAEAIENFEAYKTSRQERSKAILDFNTALVDKLDPAVMSAIGDSKSFLYTLVLEKDEKTNKRKDYIRDKVNTRRIRPSKLPKAHIEILKNAKAFTAGDKLANQIRSILGESTASPIDKINKIQSKYGEEIAKRNDGNLLAMYYYWQAVYDVISENPSLATGMLLHMQSLSDSRANLASMTTLSDIEVYGPSQAPYINPKTNKGVWLSYNKARTKLKNGELIVNVNHPLYNQAKEFAATSVKPAEAFMQTYHEHSSPLSKINGIIFEQIQRHASKVILNPAQTIVRKRLFKESLKAILDRFDQQITSTLSAAISDTGVSKGGFGRTSEAGDFRMSMLPSSIQNSIYEIRTGSLAINRINEKVQNAFPEGLKIDEDQVAKQTSENKKSVTIPTAIFMVGGPGSGKSSIVKGLDLIEKGYRYVNQDPYLEKYIKEAGLPTDEKTYDKEQRSIRAKLGWKARKEAEADLERFTAGKESMVIDGTGASYKATTKKIKALEAAGFEVHMIFVNTSKDVAVKRNRARAERSLADFIVTKTWDNVQESAKQYREDYPGKFYEINTDELRYGQSLPSEFVNTVDNGLNDSQRKLSVSLSEELNNMIERQKGVAADKTFSRVQAKMMGEKKGKYRVFVPASAEDFRGLTSYTFAGKGKQGEADQKFIEDNLITPYVRGVAQIEAVKQQIRREYHAVAKGSKQYFKMLGKKIGNTDYTYDQALRVYMWTQQGIEVPGMTKDDIVFLVNEISQIPGLIQLGNAMQAISRQDTWVEPTEHWMSNTLVSDLNSMTEKVGRKKYLQEFIENSEVIFSPENLNKIEAIYGTRHREAIEDALYSMINGRNRPTGMNKQMNQWLNWVNNSTGAIMFFNIRSAVLQTLSATNFINWSDNNPLKAAAAFANQKQYWADFAMIFNSDKLKQRRSGLQTDVNTAEIANQAEGAQNKAGAVIAYLLKIGFTPTQIADSFAIATGGATFYRNRVNTYLKQGMELEAAEKKAFEDFGKTADEAQQSSDPYLVSQEQRSPLGRLVLAFQNTPMQYTRLMKKAMLDLANGRGDAKTHISKIIYYGAVQNFIFSAMQSALFAMIPGFDDEEDESGLTDKELEKKREKEQRKEDTRYLRIINSMTDSILKGSGVKGAVIATIKNTVTEYFKQKEKGWTADHAYTLLAALSLSPPIGSKVRKIYSAIQGEKFDKDVLEARGFSIMADGRINLSPAYSIIGSLVSGTANIPMDRMVDIINSMVEATDTRNTIWQRIALGMGWKTWDVGAKNEEHDLIIQQAKEKRKEEGKEKAKKTREANKKKKKEAEDKAMEELLIKEAERQRKLLKNK